MNLVGKVWFDGVCQVIGQIDDQTTIPMQCIGLDGSGDTSSQQHATNSRQL